MQWKKKKKEKANLFLFSQLLRLKLYMLKKYKTLFQVLSGRIQWLIRFEALTFLPRLRFPTYYTVLVKKEFFCSYHAVHFFFDFESNNNDKKRSMEERFWVEFLPAAWS